MTQACFQQDVARVESKTVISTPNKLDTVPQPSDGVQGQLGYWMSPDDLNKKVQELYPGCMKGRQEQLHPSFELVGKEP
jgi:phosphoenolpyruvate carboxykinase (GTP)